MDGRWSAPAISSFPVFSLALSRGFLAEEDQVPDASRWRRQAYASAPAVGRQQGRAMPPDRARQLFIYRRRRGRAAHRQQQPYKPGPPLVPYEYPRPRRRNWCSAGRPLLRVSWPPGARPSEARRAPSWARSASGWRPACRRVTGISASRCGRWWGGHPRDSSRACAAAALAARHRLRPAADRRFEYRQPAAGAPARGAEKWRCAGSSAPARRGWRGPSWATPCC